MASAGIRRQLGTPTLDPLVVLLREATQNSWDARSDENGRVRLEYRFETVDGGRANAFRRLLCPGPFDAFDDVAETSFATLCVSDRGTSGLGGPIRSDEPAPEDESPDFVNLVRNVGEPRDRAYGGGTYGFGKGSLFRVSLASTILVDTRCRFRGRLQRRLMGAALGPTFVREGRRHTGRHWWGVQAVDGVVDPLVDARADATAAELGLNGFEGDDTGTDVYVLFVDAGQGDETNRRTLFDAAQLLAGSASWYLWPKLIERDGPRQLDLSVTVDGHDIAVPDPVRSRRIRPFVQAIRKLDAGEGRPHTRQREPRHVGDFAVVTDLVVAAADDTVDVAAPFDGPAHHCARMRHVELVVDYLEGPPSSEPDVQYGAVFRASDQAEAYFAAAEPPTHDAWVHQHLTGAAKGVVLNAQSFVRRELAGVVGVPTAAAAARDVPLGRISAALAKTLPGAFGDGAGGGGSGEGGDGGGGGGGGGVISTTLPQLDLVDGEPRVVQRFTVADAATVTVRCDAHVAVDGARERLAPAGAAVPQILGWRSDSGQFVLGDALQLGPSEERSWRVEVRPAPMTSTTVRVRAERTS